MSDLIDRQAAIDAIERNAYRHTYIDQIVDVIRDLPSAEPERKVGKWLFTDAAPHRVYCSVCYKTFVPNKEWIAWKEDMIPRSYCPNCGARMDGD